MSDARRLPLANTDEVAFALTHAGRKRTHDAAEMMTAQRRPITGGAALGRGFEARS